ncbi:MAG TPA: hypothetical protein VHP33_10370, partial [Polyangiaceae bacterium]|nr:hypothetical protein [Polyangiaceae bacterium]
AMIVIIQMLVAGSQVTELQKLARDHVNSMLKEMGLESSDPPKLPALQRFAQALGFGRRTPSKPIEPH